MTSHGRNYGPTNSAANFIASDGTMTADFTVELGAIQIATLTGAPSPTSGEVFIVEARRGNGR